jgi:hypothetical protein
MKLKLISGEIIEADGMRDCTCITHKGPHWLHMDEFDKAQNSKLLAQAEGLIQPPHTSARYMQAQALFRRFCEFEIVRLGQKADAMVSAGVVEVMREDQ